jgi:hypothetical protein
LVFKSHDFDEVVAVDILGFSCGFCHGKWHASKSGKYGSLNCLNYDLFDFFDFGEARTNFLGHSDSPVRLSTIFSIFTSIDKGRAHIALENHRCQRLEKGELALQKPRLHFCFVLSPFDVGEIIKGPLGKR